MMSKRRTNTVLGLALAFMVLVAWSGFAWAEPPWQQVPRPRPGETKYEKLKSKVDLRVEGIYTSCRCEDELASLGAILTRGISVGISCHPCGGSDFRQAFDVKAKVTLKYFNLKDNLVTKTKTATFHVYKSGGTTEVQMVPSSRVVLLKKFPGLHADVEPYQTIVRTEDCNPNNDFKQVGRCIYAPPK